MDGSVADHLHVERLPIESRDLGMPGIMSLRGRRTNG